MSQKFAFLQIFGLLEGINTYSIQEQGCFKVGKQKINCLLHGGEVCQISGLEIN